MTATPRPDARPSPGWRAVRALIRRELLRTCRWQLGNRALHLADGEKVRWLPEDIERFLVTLDRAAEEMREIAGLQTLPDGGSRLMVELAIYTVAADARSAAPRGRDGVRARGRHRCRLGTLPPDAAPVVAVRATLQPRSRAQAALDDPGAAGVSLPPGRRPGPCCAHLSRWRRPANAFRTCPPQTFARAAAAHRAEPELLEAFRESWSLNDWPGANLIAGDGKRGHSRRPQTLSAGKARASKKGNV